MLVTRIILGAVGGGAVGALLGRSTVCGGGLCSVRNRLIPCILAGAVAGAVVGYVWGS